MDPKRKGNLVKAPTTRRLEGKVALVTGAARGIGAATAIRFAQEGANIIACDLMQRMADFYSPSTPDDFAATVSAVEAVGQQIVWRKVDIRDQASLTALVDDGVGQFGRLDTVVAAAGMGAVPHLTHDLPESMWQDVIDVNLTGQWHTAKAATRWLLRQPQGGSITFISSIVGLKGKPTVGQYVAAKHALVGLMRSMALELGPHMIRVNSVHPTQVDTVLIKNPPTYQVFRPDLKAPGLEDFKQASQALHIMPQPWVEPIDVANAALFLASDEARFVTGAMLPVDLGSSIQ